MGVSAALWSLFAAVGYFVKFLTVALKEVNLTWRYFNSRCLSCKIHLAAQVWNWHSIRADAVVCNSSGGGYALFGSQAICVWRLLCHSRQRSSWGHSLVGWSHVRRNVVRWHFGNCRRPLLLGAWSFTALCCSQRSHIAGYRFVSVHQGSRTTWVFRTVPIIRAGLVVSWSWVVHASSWVTVASDLSFVSTPKPLSSCASLKLLDSLDCLLELLLKLVKSRSLLQLQFWSFHYVFCCFVDFFWLLN